MSFTHALYYPWIEIQDVGWLKNSILYWDRISTIVPTDINLRPAYQTAEELALEDAGILHPYHVFQGMDVVEAASDIFSDYIDAPESSGIILPSGVSITRNIRAFESTDRIARLHVEKVSRGLRNKLLRTGRVRENGYWLEFDHEAINYYMSVLAAVIGQNQGWALLTDQEAFEAVNNRVRRGDIPDDMNLARNERLREGFVAKLALQTVKIPADTPIETVLDFREAHRGELGRFRSAIGDLADTFNQDATIEALQQHADDIYANEIRPAIDNLRDDLRRSRIRAFVSNLSTFIFAGTVGALSAYLVSQFGPNAAVINWGLSTGAQLTASKVNFRLDRSELLQNNKFSYVLQAERGLSENSS